MMYYAKYDKTGIKTVSFSGHYIYALNFKLWCYSVPTHHVFIMAVNT
jgi:hypothetical protein